MLHNKMIRSGQRLLSGPQIFGYTEDVHDRVLETLTQPASSQSVNWLIKPQETEEKFIETYAPTSTPNPVEKPISDVVDIKYSDDYISIHKTTLIVIIGVILAMVIFKLWIQAKHLETVIYEMQLREKGLIN